MRKQLLAGAMAVALATGMTTSAMAFDRGGGGFHGGGFHSGFAGSRGSFAAMHGGNFAGVRGFSGYRHGAWGSRRFVGGGYGGYGYGPYYDDVGVDVGLGLLGLGVGLATAGYGYCSPYVYDYGYCGSGFIVGW